MLGFDIDGLRVGRCVAEGLHDQIGGETQTGKVFQFIAGHRAGSILATHGSHLGLTVTAGTNTFDAAGFADHLLGEGIALI